MTAEKDVIFEEILDTILNENRTKELRRYESLRRQEEEWVKLSEEEKEIVARKESSKWGPVTRLRYASKYLQSLQPLVTYKYLTFVFPIFCSTNSLYVVYGDITLESLSTMAAQHRSAPIVESQLYVLIQNHDSTKKGVKDPFDNTFSTEDLRNDFAVHTYKEMGRSVKFKAGRYPYWNGWVTQWTNIIAKNVAGNDKFAPLSFRFTRTAKIWLSKTRLTKLPNDYSNILSLDKAMREAYRRAQDEKFEIGEFSMVKGTNDDETTKGGEYIKGFSE